MNKKYFNRRNGLCALVALFVLIISTQHPHDFDLGWHLRNGQYFFMTGHVLRDNILSFVWPNFHWVQISWGYDLIVYLIFTYLGFFGLAFSAGLITLFIFLIITWPIKRLHPSILLLLAVIYLTQTVLMYLTGLRDQTVSALFFTFTLVISVRFLEGKKDRIGKVPLFYTLPPLFLIWANLHGGFILGLGILIAMWTGFIPLFLIKPKTTISFKSWVKFGFIMLLSSLLPIINPWGIALYTEAIKHTVNLNLTLVTEWSPITDYPLFTVITSLITIFVVVALVYTKRLAALPYLVGFLLITSLAFGAVRFLILFGIMAVYFLSQTLPEINFKFLNKTWLKVVLVVVLLSLVIYDARGPQNYFNFPKPNIFTYNWNDYCMLTSSCDENITKMMIANPPKGNGYNPYNYGGYLEWRVPKVKTFVDGRMAAWEENGQVPPIRQTLDLSSESVLLSYKQFDSKYHFNWVIMPTLSPVLNYLDELVKLGQWKIIYHDPYFSYYVKK